MDKDQTQKKKQPQNLELGLLGLLFWEILGAPERASSPWLLFTPKSFPWDLSTAILCLKNSTKWLQQVVKAFWQSFILLCFQVIIEEHSSFFWLYDFPGSYAVFVTWKFSL